MSEQQIDPAGNTQAFRAFAQRDEQEAAPQKKSYTLPIVGVVLGVVILALAVYLLVR
ncbi:hypothetical protein [Sinosporangium siamense]|uniref:Uncharacterized protein n=1 Tax=Sinosporangium siamense TaxID=1367973 RepID=A0A919V3N4_9ACTN|nr:hypothetical protein [Sinosporangium siamense]GII91125.1 hypothetical protein Ssi02_13560 [Sinosporangium siamense]